MRTTLGGWLRAQLKLMGITFLILNAGLLLLRVRYPVLAALVITVVDALPVFGTGTILIPWALALFLQGETKTGIGLVILYGAAALSRQALEPRLVGKQVGLNPVLTLLALYTGYRLLGVGGMIVFPIAAMLFKQLWDHSGLQPDGSGGLRDLPPHGIIAPKEAVRMILEQTAARQTKLLSLLRREFGLSAGWSSGSNGERAVCKRSARPYRCAGHARATGCASCWRSGRRALTRSRCRFPSFMKMNAFSLWTSLLECWCIRRRRKTAGRWQTACCITCWSAARRPASIP